MDKTCYFFRIPTEVMCMIVGHLSPDDKISLKFAFPHFFCQHRHINVREAFVCNQEKIEEILHRYNPDVVTKLDFNFCYWLSRKEISEFARSCNYLKELSVAYTNILVKDIAEVLSRNIKISKLSLSIQNPNSYWCVQHSVVEYLQWFQEHPTNEISSNIFWKNLLSLSQLESAKELLAQLNYLDLYIGQDPLILGTILSACKNLESLCLRLDMEERQPTHLEDLEKENMTPRKEINELLDILTLENDECCSPVPPISLKSIVVLVHDRNKNLEGPMGRFIQKIVEKSNSQLQCLWTAVPFLSVRDSSFNLNNMVAWKETKNYNNIILSFKRLPSIESVACDEYMESGDFNLPQLKQIECGFSKDNFINFCRSHPVLEKLRLNKRHAGSIRFNIVDWSRLPPVKVFSVHSRVIHNSDSCLGNRGMGNQALCVLLKECKSLEELEIGPDFSETPDDITMERCFFSRGILLDPFLTANSLCGLTLCTNLKKFSLNSVTISYKEEEINDASLLEEIVTKCPNLESLKIQDLGVLLLTIWGITFGFDYVDYTRERQYPKLERLYWSTIERCFLTLRSANKLRVLRWKMRIVSEAYDKLIWLLTYCPSLIQLGLIATSVLCGLDMYTWDEATFTAFFVDLVRHLPKLIALLIVLPGIPASHCIAATTVLESTFRPVRPCFCVQITDSLESSNPPNLPWIHYQALACDPYTSVGELPFHLNTSDSNF